MKMKKATTVDEYISLAPPDVQAKLKEIRKAIFEAAPDAEEGMSYGMPYYGYKGRLTYFANAKKHIGLYIPPPIIENHAEDLKAYVTSVSAVQFPLTRDLPIPLIKKLVKARVAWNDKAEEQKKK
jgi:uncharacterized protein YdhG (YjbR/CyaY superfamily)